jgi:diguanylate cyclase (GGDEF)-like protein
MNLAPTPESMAQASLDELRRAAMSASNVIQPDYRPARGEVIGSFLLGLIESFQRLRIMRSDHTPVDHIDPTQWYPQSVLIDTLNGIQRSIPSFENLFFRAGMNFVRIWYEDGPGKALIRSGRDFLDQNRGNALYDTVMRGGSRDDIGWCRLESIDESKGIAVYENVLPFSPDFVRGVFYGGCILFDDMDYVAVEVQSERYARNLDFYRNLVTIRFHMASPGDDGSLAHKLDALQPGTALALSASEIDRLVWRHKALTQRKALDDAYYKDISTLLGRSIEHAEAQRDDISRLSNHDSLTGLPNATLAEERLRGACLQATHAQTRVAVLFADLDGFKHVNDSYGHDAGDLVLKTVAQRLTTCVRKTDTVARRSGDEFLIILHDLGDLAIARRIARKIVSAIPKPIDIDQHAVRVGISIGVSIFPDLTQCPDDLVRMADAAMYVVKRSGKNNWRLYEPPK